MAITTVNIHGKAYQIKTSDGQESHVQKLAHELNQKIFALAEHLSNVDREYLLILASIMSLDEALEKQIIPEDLNKELESYKAKLKNAQNHIESLKDQLEKLSEKSMEIEKEEALKASQKLYEDEQKLKFENQRKLYEEQIANLQMQIVDNHNNLSKAEEFEDYLEKMLKKQEQELTDKFNIKMSERIKAYEKEHEDYQKTSLQAEKKEGTHIDTSIDLLKTIADRLETP